MKHKIVLISLIILAMLPSSWAAPVVSNVRLHQIDGTKQVHITYDVADNFNTSLWVTVSVSTNGVALPTLSVTGDVNRIISPGKGKSLVWDAGEDWNGRYTEIAKAKVTAFYPKYMVVDMSGGSSAAKFPISYLPEVPTGGWPIAYRGMYLLLRRIEGGTFMMGSPESEYGRSSNEDLHEVTLTKPFYIGVFEFTAANYYYLAGYNTGSSYIPRVLLSYDDLRGSGDGYKWPLNALVDSGSLIGKIREKTGVSSFDLPTEAMWEYACRAGTTSAFNNGNDMTTASNYYDLSGFVDTLSSTYNVGIVGQYRPNRWGLYDMHGNAFEWCLDWYADSLGGGSVVDPKGPESRLDSGSYRVVKGGGYTYTTSGNGNGASGVSSFRSAWRYPVNCMYKSASSSPRYQIGFRLVCSPE